MHLARHRRVHLLALVHFNGVVFVQLEAENVITPTGLRDDCLARLVENFLGRVSDSKEELRVFLVVAQ